MDLLAPDVVAIADGGGRVVAARRPVLGRAEVARFVLGVHRTSVAPGAVDIRPALYNGMPAACFGTVDGVDWLVAFQIHAGRVTGLYAMRNPDKLRRAHPLAPGPPLPPDPARRVRPVRCGRGA
ncbi:hypothetical protein RCO28_22680 [Streptomyces sp. LHD-70]|uniref:hypothetical protein n=1 Tax=Streptomyces sp. LHD-70 TaxID=3072140 RepID=UPI00280D0DE0|nr:hypothetical protein [Streptomyces sp. LHD-70]MDQ8705279.1 hypothetical protein [Streptomyces sp. LHD-70]